MIPTTAIGYGIGTSAYPPTPYTNATTIDGMNTNQPSYNGHMPHIPCNQTLQLSATKPPNTTPVTPTYSDHDICIDLPATPIHKETIIQPPSPIL